MSRARTATAHPTSRGRVGRLVAAARRRAKTPLASVAGGSALGQLALLVSLPLVARLYTPAHIGVFGVVLALGQIACIAVTARLEQALPRLQPDQRWTVARFGLLCGGALAVPAGFVISVLGDRAGAVTVAAASFLVASLVLLNVGTFALLGAKDYQGVAQLRISNGVVTAIASVVGGLVYPQVWTLLVAYAVGNVAGATRAVPAIRRLRNERGRQGFVGVAAEERLGRFALSVGSGAVMSSVSLALPLVGAAVLFGDVAAASFFLARRFLMAPTQLVAASVSEVSYAMVARQDARRISDFFHSWLRRSILPGALLVGLGLVAAPLAPLAVGEGYDSLGWVIVLLTAPAVAQMIATSFSNLLLALHLEHVRMLWNIVRLAGLLLVFVWANETSAGYVMVVAVYSAWLVLAYAALLSLTWRGVHRMSNAA